MKLSWCKLVLKSKVGVLADHDMHHARDLSRDPCAPMCNAHGCGFFFFKRKLFFRSYRGMYHARDLVVDQVPMSITAVTWKKK